MTTNAYTCARTSRAPIDDTAAIGGGAVQRGAQAVQLEVATPVGPETRVVPMVRLQRLQATPTYPTTGWEEGIGHRNTPL